MAGCSDAAPSSDEDGDGAAPPGTMPLEGVVVDEAIRPLAGVRVELDGAANATTGGDGLFRFDAAPGAHVVRAAKAGYADAVTQVTLAASGEPAPLVKLVLITDAGSLPFAEVQKIQGYVECGTDTFNRYFAAC